MDFAKKVAAPKAPALDLKEKHKSREAWLIEVASKVRPMIAKRANIEVPATTLISCGLPSIRALSSKNRTIGQCWVKQGQVFVSPVIEHPLDVAQVLVHELLHAGLPNGTGHKAPFKRAADAMALGGKPTATIRTEEFDAYMLPVIQKVGSYPHRALVAEKGSKQTTRLVKLECPDCGYIVRTTAKWIETGLPSCSCGGYFEEGS